MKTAIQRWSLGKKEWDFFFDEHDIPFVEVNGKTYRQETIAQLFSDNSILNDPAHLRYTAQLINFLIKGLNFQMIENIQSYKQEYLDKQNQGYKERYSQGQQGKYPIYNVEEIQYPKIKGSSLIFYVNQEINDIPYRVIVNYPILNDPITARYELLPTA